MRVLRLDVLGEHEHAGLRVVGADPLGRHQPLVGVRGRHPDVDQRDVGPVALDRLVAGRSASAAVATTSKPCSRSSAATPSRTSAASSAITTRTGAARPLLPAAPAPRRGARAARAARPPCGRRTRCRRSPLRSASVTHDRGREHLAAARRARDARGLHQRAAAQLAVEPLELAAVDAGADATAASPAPARAAGRPRSAARRHAAEREQVALAGARPRASRRARRRSPRAAPRSPPAPTRSAPRRSARAAQPSPRRR